jgi:hypothetical protein
LEFDSLGEFLTIEAMRKSILLILGLAFLLGAGPKTPEIVTIQPLKALELQPGSHAEFQIDLQIVKGFHIQANPASEPYLIPTTLKLETMEGIKASDPVYPKGTAFQLNGSEKAISTYEGLNTIKVPFDVDAHAESGERILKGSLRYQGCDSRTCYPPTTISFEEKINVNK